MNHKVAMENAQYFESWATLAWSENRVIRALSMLIPTHPVAVTAYALDSEREDFLEIMSDLSDEAEDALVDAGYMVVTGDEWIGVYSAEYIGHAILAGEIEPDSYLADAIAYMLTDD